VPLAYSLKKLRKMQRRIALWISGAFHTSPMSGIETIAGLISIHLHFQKLSSRSQLRAHSLLSNHIIKLLLEMRSSNDNEPQQLLLEILMPRQQTIIKGHVVNRDNRFNEVVSFFSSFHYKFSPRNRVIDIFPNHFSFHYLNRKSNHSIKSYLCNLNSITFQVLLDLHSFIVILLRIRLPY